MIINSSGSLRERSKVTLGGFKGLDTLNSSVEVSAIHSTEMQNLISRDGVNHKRYGWKTRTRLRHDSKFLPIRAIFSFTIYLQDFVLAYADRKFWWIKDGENIDITNKSIDSTSLAIKEKTEYMVEKLEDQECKCFVNGNKVYFVGCGDFLVFSKWSNDMFELRSVVGNEDVYIPTTTENIGSEEDGQHLERITAEERNILSPYSYNTLFGVNELPFAKDDKQIVDLTYYLDTKNITDIEVTVEKEGVKKATLTRANADQSTYEVGEKITTISFNLGNTKHTVQSSTTVKQELVEYQKIIPADPVDTKRRWFKSADAIAENKFVEKNVVKAMETINPKTNKPFGDYQVYLDYMFEELMGYKPDTTYKEPQDKVETYYANKKYSEFIIRPLSSIELIEMENGDKLIIKNSPFVNSELTYLKHIAPVDIMYKAPLKIQCSLVYKESNGKETVLYNISSRTVDCVIDEKSVTETEMSATLTIDYGFLATNLSGFDAIIKTFKTDTKFYGSEEEGKNIISLAGGNYTGSINLTEGKLVLHSVEGDANAYKPLTADVPNITVKITRIDDISVVTASTLACEFGTQGVADRLFVVDSVGNIVRWSKDEDFTYFGDKSFLTCGTADKKITGMDRLNDSTLLVVKEYSPREPALFVIQGKFSGEETNSIIDYKAIFNARGYQVGRGAVGELINFNGECLMVCEDGLYSVSVGENVAIDSRYVTQRSRQITNTLEKYDLSKAKCISFGGKFYVGVGNECYVADSKYMVTFAEGQSANYEWWKWTNLPINTWGVVGNELWFGTEDGQICSFTKDFFDETVTSLDNTLIGYNFDSDLNIVGFSLNENIKVAIGDKLTPKVDFYGGITVKVECVNKTTKLFVPLNDYLEKEEIYIDNVSYQITKENTYCSIQYETDKTELLIYKNYKDKELYVTNVEVLDTNAKALALMDKLGNEPIWSRVDANGGLNPQKPFFKAILSHKETVVSKWVSGAMDLGTRSYSKSLTFITLTGEKDLANRLKYGINTRFNHKDYELLRANNDLDFYGLDLQTVSLDSQFASSYSKRLNVRNVNFIMFYFISDTAEDIALNSVQIEFKIHKRNIGVR